MTAAERDQYFQEALDRRIYTKNIDYIYNDATHYGPDNIQALNEITVLGGTPTQTAWFLQNGYAMAGKQVQVAKNVSDDLLRTDFDIESQMDNIVWPALFVEVYFEDPAIPTILLSKTTLHERQKLFPRIEFTGDRLGEELAALVQEGKGLSSAQSTLLLTPRLYKQVLFDGGDHRMTDFGLLNADLNNFDAAVLNKLVRLSLAAFVFASIERFRPADLSRKQMHWGGKSGVGNRPQRPAKRVFYAPSVKTIGQSGETGAKRTFTGRIGHWRFYKDERYTNMYRKWDFIPEIKVDPASGEIVSSRPVIKVRKAQ